MRILCLANSIREGGRCVAGLNCATGCWARPVMSQVIVRFPDIGPLSTIGFSNLVTSSTSTCRNRRLRCHTKRRTTSFAVQRCKLSAIVLPATICNFANRMEPLPHTWADRVGTDYYNNRGVEEWRSLQLIHPAAVAFQHDHWNPHRWRAVFQHGQNMYSLKVTDPLCTAKLDAGTQVGPDCLLTVSLTAPWAPPDGSHPEACYKLIAAVIGLRQQEAAQ